MLQSKYTFAEIIALQKQTLDEKIKLSVEALTEAFKKSNHNVAIAFSGGKDSQVVSDLIERFLPKQFQRLHCIFGNTGIEFPESLKFARKYGIKHYGERFHETKLSELAEDELRYDFARQIVTQLEAEDALDEILKPDGKLKGQKALIAAALKRDYVLHRNNCFFKGHIKNFAYCIEQYGAPLLGKATSKLDEAIDCLKKLKNEINGGNN